MINNMHIGVVIIGRNEGARLIRCLASIPDIVDRIVYVDSGSTDTSTESARKAGAHVVALDLNRPFTAARARNEGARVLMADDPVDFIQFIDGDCELQSTWIETALAFLMDNPTVAVACGRRRERFPQTTIYNRMCDHEWDTPVGQTRACGGDALMRAGAFQSVGGFDPALIAGEEPELCVRLRAAGWQIWRLDHEMTLHDAALMRFSQWWKRAKRGGYAFAQGAAMHGSPPECHFVKETRRALFWGGVIPLVSLLVCLVSAWGLLGFLSYPAQVVRLAARGGFTRPSLEKALFATIAKFPETLGILEFYKNRTLKRRAEIIEYK